VPKLPFEPHNSNGNAVERCDWGQHVFDLTVFSSFQLMSDVTDSSTGPRS
jgi:hypothetical protein